VITYVLLAAVLIPIAMALIAAVVFGAVSYDPPAVAQRDSSFQQPGSATSAPLPVMQTSPTSRFGTAVASTALGSAGEPSRTTSR
jgi:hypothetical protein